MCVPILARNRVLGVMQFVTSEPGGATGAGSRGCRTPRPASRPGHRQRFLYQAAERERATAQASLEYLRRSEARFKRLVESGIIGIILGEHDRITEANDVFLEMLGYTRGGFAARGGLQPRPVDAAGVRGSRCSRTADHVERRRVRAFRERIPA